VDQYVAAHRHYGRDDPGQRAVDRMAELGLDAEALELVLRRRHPTLSRKCRILVYLAEATPEGYQRLVNTTPRPLAGWLALATAGLRTIWLYAKGTLLARRHRLG